MHLCDLPDNVLRLVLQAAVYRDRRNASLRLKSSLPLLAVCRRWRRLACASVYDTAYIKCYTRSSGGAYDSDPSEDDLKAEATKAEMTSNLDLIVTTGCVNTVKGVHIKVWYRRYPLPALKNAVQAIRNVTKEWRGPRVLRIDLDPRYDSEDEDDYHEASHADDISQITAALGATMPGISRLSFKGTSPSHATSALCGRLAENYADQLQGIDSNHSISMSPDFLLGQLRKLHIFDNSKHHSRLSSINPAGLEYLDLKNWLADHMWAPFGMGSNAKDIEFPRLKEFRVSYSHTGAAGGHPQRLHFPELRLLYLNGSQDVCPLLESMVLPPRMDRVDISVSASALRRVSKMAPLAIKHFTLEIRSASEGDPATLTAINCILGSVHGARIFELEIKDRLLTVMPETLACTGLTHLGIAAPISLDAMLGFIRKLPNLASMGLWELVLDDIQADISVPAPEECHPMEPLDTRLKVVSINVNRSQPSWSMVTQATKYLLLRIPTLIALDAVHASYKPVMKFVDAYSKLYPHLANVKLLLNASDRSFVNQSGRVVSRPWREHTH